MNLWSFAGKPILRNLMSALISLLLALFFAAVWFNTLFYDSQSMGDTSVILGILGLPVAAVFFVWLSYRTLLQKRASAVPGYVANEHQNLRATVIEDIYNSNPDNYVRTMVGVMERLRYKVVATNWSDNLSLELTLERDGQTELACCHRSSGSIRLTEVSRFMDRMAASGVSRGYLITTGDFSLASREATIGKGLHLVDGEELAELLSATESG